MEIRLEENPSTGYRWEVFSTTGPEITKSSYQRSGPTYHNGELLVGGGGIRILEIQGHGEITLVLRHPWNHAEEIERKTFTLP